MPSVHMYFSNQSYVNDYIVFWDGDLMFFILSLCVLGSTFKCINGLCEQTNKWIKNRKFKCVNENLLPTSSAICSICLEDYSNTNEKICKIPCEHIFHKKCIKDWLEENNTCPECRTEINS